MIKYRQMILVGSILFILTGCQTVDRQTAATVDAIVPTFGYVDMSKVEALDPRMNILRGVDQALLSDARFNQVRTANSSSPEARNYLEKMALRGAQGSIDPREVQQRNLVTAQAGIIAELQARLQASDASDIDALRSVKKVEGDQQFQTAIGLLQDQAASEIDQDRVDSARIASLKMQIAAMALNENPPPTAPEGHWDNLRIARQTELNTVLQSYNAKLNAIYASRDKLIEEERIKIDQAIDTEVNSENAAIVARQDQIIVAAEKRFTAEQNDLINEDETVYRQAQAFVNPLSTDVSLDESIPPTGVNQSATVLKLYRMRLEASILADAYATVTSISKELHLKIVRQRPGVRDVTALIVQSAKERNWKLS